MRRIAEQEASQTAVKIAKNAMKSSYKSLPLQLQFSAASWIKSFTCIAIHPGSQFDHSSPSLVGFERSASAFASHLVQQIHSRVAGGGKLFLLEGFSDGCDLAQQFPHLT